MVMALSYIIAIVITVFLAISLYPIACFFYVVGAIGKAVGKLSEFIFRNTNKGIRGLWSDIAHTRVVRDDEIVGENLPPSEDMFATMNKPEQK